VRVKGPSCSYKGLGISAPGAGTQDLPGHDQSGNRGRGGKRRDERNVSQKKREDAVHLEWLNQERKVAPGY